jgi:phosphoserine aminotransferase
MKKHNFSAGPSILSPYTIQHTAEGILDLNQSGLSVMEISHRSKDFMAIMDETQQLFKDLLDIPSGYSVLLLQGGASMQFCMLPYNLLKTKAAYLDTGAWASKAIKEAKLFGEVEVVVAASKDSTYSYIPKGLFQVPSDADYFHITTNNTIYGTEIKQDMDVRM